LACRHFFNICPEWQKLIALVVNAPCTFAPKMKIYSSYKVIVKIIFRRCTVNFIKNTTSMIRILIITFVLSCLACRREIEPISPTPSARNYSKELTAMVNMVILPTMGDLEEKLGAFITHLYTLLALRNEVSLQAARQGWREARSPWEQSECFCKGPSDILGTDQNMDTWPVNIIDLQLVLNDTDVISMDYVRSLPPGLKGFHTIEYLLFGTSGNRPVQELSEREIQYLIACAQILQEDERKWREGWTVGTDNYADKIRQAGQPGNSTYPTQRSAIQDVASHLHEIIDELGNIKISEPLATGNIDLEESRFSSNSLNDFRDNVRGIRNIYQCIYNGTVGSSLSDIVRENDSALDAKLVRQIEEAIEALTAVSGTFSQQVIENGTEINFALAKIMALEATIRTELLPLTDALQ
jgi:putative iron-regulated protein